MNVKKFDPPLEVKILDHSYQFSSVGDFTFALEGRCSVTTNKLQSLLGLSIEELHAESIKVTEVNQRLFSIVTEIVEDPDSIVTKFRDLEPTIFSQDQGWRSIILSLFECNEDYNPLRSAALTMYMQYLSALDDTIKLIKAEKESIPVQDQHAMEFGATWGPGNLLLDQQPSFGIDNGMKKLPKDSPIEVKLPAGEKMNFRLASHKCQLVASNDNFQFVDKDRILSLKKGSYVIGRSNKSAIQIDPSVKDVSRSHLIIEVFDGNVVHLTDTSTAGSYIPLQYLQRT